MRRSSFPRPQIRKSTAHSGRAGSREGSPYAPFTERAIAIIRSIPRGKVASYGQVAGIAGSPLAARQVVRILHTLSGAERLPWHRVINSAGSIALPRGAGFEQQMAALRREGVRVRENGTVDLKRHGWSPRLRAPL